MPHPKANLFQVRECNRPPAQPNTQHIRPHAHPHARTATNAPAPHTRGAIIHTRWDLETWCWSME
ncbi:hypothetical protein FIBSPDRAFT_875517, partial [Athelia psychrophila]